ncbi:MAG: RNA polymerase subunit sigma-24, partial [Candidatus Competibacteraceae bacterium]|nr:RNA polymerase subunit sigma-24 [Candidatus Competibacteraceae bacterium]
DQEQIAQVLGVSIPTVKRDLRFARAYVGKALDDG